MSSTKITQNSSKSENDEKWENEKKWKSDKNKKMQKHKNAQNAKLKNHEKSVKNHQKSWKPVLRPKMQKTGVHAVWQKCPHQMARKTRKVTFTPLSDIPPLFWPISCFDNIFTFVILSLFMFLHFDDFDILVILTFSSFSLFLPLLQ